MAIIYPADIEEYKHATDGEKRVFRFLKKAAKPDRDFICCYKSITHPSEKKPDFIISGRKLGVVIIEVKDWTSKQIIAYNPREFTLMIDGEPLKRINPDKQAKGFTDDVKEILSKNTGLLSNEIQHRKDLKSPIGRMVAFPNISRKEYTESGFKWFIDPERIFFKEDLDPAGEIICDITGRAFFKKISGCLPFSPPILTPKEFDKIWLAIWPGINIEIPERSGSGKQKFKREVMRLDESQARLALKLGSGHQIIKGPPGTGKTLILAYRCSHLLKYQPEKKRLLFVCYNIALVSYLKRVLQKKKIVNGENGVEVFHFFELCSKILSKTVHYENEDREYYDHVIREAVKKLKSDNSLLKPFDAVFVDEAQDFNNEMLKVISNLLVPKGDLVIALDSFQDLYRHEASWKSVGIKASGRTHYIKKAYRNTKPLFEFSQNFLGKTTKNNDQMTLFPDEGKTIGKPPEIKRFKNLEEIENFLAQDILRAIDEEEYKRSEIAVIYDDKVYGQDRFTYDNRALPMRIISSLESHDIPSSWISRDAKTKETYDVATDRVSVISIHSSKGLDFDLVYLAGIDHIKPSRSFKKNMDAIVYVGITRAKYRLVIPYIEETEIIQRIKACV